MAARAQAPAKEPPVFEGRPQDDVIEWLQEYEDVAEYNHWNQGQKLRQVKWALKGFAKNWYRMLEPEPDTFDGFSEAIRAAFKHPAYESGMAAQLDARKQGIDESPVLYCYEKLNLCRKVDPDMAEGVKLQHLIRGMKPAMVERVYPSINFAAPDTAAVIRQVQLLHQASWVANSNSWAPPGSESIPHFSMQQQTPDISSGQAKQSFVTRDEFERELKKHRKDVNADMSTFKKDLTNDLTRELGQRLDSFREVIMESTKKAVESVGESLLRKSKTNSYQPSGKRSEDGRPICNGCGKVGHIERNCLAKVQCRFCKKTGHLERNCYQKKQNASKDDRSSSPSRATDQQGKN